MADDNQVEIRFAAATDDALAGIAQVRDAVAQLAEPVRALDDRLEQMSSSFGAALPADRVSELAKAFADVAKQADDGVAPVKEIAGEIKLLQLGLAEKRVLFNAEANQFRITQDQKFALLEAETQREYEAALALLEQEAAIGGMSVEQRQKVLEKIAQLEAKHRVDMLKLDEQAIAQQQQMWTSALGSIESAFNSQLRGLLAGTTTWSQAVKHILGDLIIKFIETCEEMMVKWLAAELAQTTATTTGAAARAAAESASADAGVAAQAAAAMRAIATDASQAFAGVFAFLAPAMGPAAAGPAAAAQASVSAAAIFDAGTDYVLRGGLALIHAGETIIPAARGSGPFTGAGTGPQIHAPVSINVSALDSQSVARFFNDNSRHMLRAINDAVKRGAHLGLRALHP